MSQQPEKATTDAPCDFHGRGHSRAECLEEFRRQRDVAGVESVEEFIAYVTGLPVYKRPRRKDAKQ